MPIPQIYVFVQTGADDGNAEPDDFEVRCVRKFNEFQLAPRVDAVHWNNYNWFMNSIADNPNHRLYRGSGGSPTRIQEFSCQDLDIDMSYAPDFMIIFNKTEEVSVEDWSCVRAWLQDVIGDCPDADFETREKGRILLQAPNIQVVRTESETASQAAPTCGVNHYRFRNFLISQKDIMIYEVIKPFTDLPYTTITTEYSERGHTPFFSSLFIVPSWGVSGQDVQFLHQVWKYLGMQGDYEPERLYRERVEACTPAPGKIAEAEPRVYRRPLEEIVERYQTGTLVTVPGRKNRN